MAIVSVNFIKLTAERMKSASGKIGVKNNVALNDLEKAQMPVAANNVALKMKFSFTSDYDPEVANITIQGEVVLVESTEKADAFMKQWTAEKSLPKDDMINIYNAVMHKCFVNAIGISKDLNLPAPIRFPRVTEKEEIKNEGSKA